jgi:uncharacterized membrane-anchored protein
MNRVLFTIYIIFALGFNIKIIADDLYRLGLFQYGQLGDGTNKPNYPKAIGLGQG